MVGWAMIYCGGMYLLGQVAGAVLGLLTLWAEVRGE